MKEAEEQVPHPSRCCTWRHTVLHSGRQTCRPQKFRDAPHRSQLHRAWFEWCCSPFVLPVHTNTPLNHCNPTSSPPTFNLTRDPALAKVLMQMLEWEGTRRCYRVPSTLWSCRILVFLQWPRGPYIILTLQKEPDSHKKCPSLTLPMMSGWIHSSLQTFQTLDVNKLEAVEITLESSWEHVYSCTTRTVLEEHLIWDTPALWLPQSARKKSRES